MRNYTSRVVILLGFGVLGTLFIILFVVALTTISFNEQRIQALVDENSATGYVFGMRDSAQRRAMILHRMALMNDTFYLDEQLMEFRDLASSVLRYRESYLDISSPEDQQFFHAQIFPKMQVGYYVQNATAELLAQGDVIEANRKFLQEVIPAQDDVLAELTKLLEKNRATLQSSISTTAKTNKTAYMTLAILGGSLFIVGIGVAIFVFRKTRRIEYDLIVAKQVEESANRTKSQFLANMSHEIRTPISAIIGFAEAALERNVNRDEKDEALFTVARNGKHLLHIINEILDVSKVEADKLEVELLPCSLVELVCDIDSLMGMQARAKGLAFAINYNFPIPGNIHTDHTRLKQILLNLSSNAIKFTHQGKVEINICHKPENHALCFSVIDTGIGMSQEQLGKIFSPFMQADASTNRCYGGTGLGLYISKKLTEKLGGNIIVNSTPEVGTRFDLTIDVGEVAAADLLHEIHQQPIEKYNPPEYAAIPMLSGKVLLAEDSEDNQRLISMYVRKLGAEIHIAKDGKEAVDKAVTQAFDLILMDMQMPIMDGIQATKALRHAGHKSPIIALTANAMREDRERCLAAGCDEFLSKPIDRKLFNATLSRILKPSTEIPSSVANDAIIDPEMLDLIQAFVSGLSDYMSKINSALHANDWQSLGELCHQLKGMGGSFGYQEITDIAAAIEKTLKSGQMDPLQSQVAMLAVVCDKAYRVR